MRVQKNPTTLENLSFFLTNTKLNVPWAYFTLDLGLSN
jgi:hypothetical protein